MTAEEFPQRFATAWTTGFEFQQSRGLYEREGDRFVATPKLALRGVLEFHLRHRTGPAYALLVVGAAVLFGVAMRVTNDSRPAAAIAGAVFGLVFQHFELPAVLAVCALGRDDGSAIVTFLFALILVATLLQRLRASRAATRL